MSTGQQTRTTPGAARPDFSTPPARSSGKRVGLRAAVDRGPARPSLAAPRSRLTVNTPGDAFEQEADRAADSVLAGGPAPDLSRGNTPGIQREDKKDPGAIAAPAEQKTQEEQYKEALEKAGEAFLETKQGKALKEKAEKEGKEFVSTVEGALITGTAVSGLLAGLIAANEALPFQAPAIPLDFIRPGLKGEIIYEGKMQDPTKAALKLTFKSGFAVEGSYVSTETEEGKSKPHAGMLSFDIPLGRRREPKSGLSDSEKMRRDNARRAYELYQFRESLKSPEQRAAEFAQFQQTLGRLRAADPLNPVNPDAGNHHFPGLLPSTDYQLQFPSLPSKPSFSLLPEGSFGSGLRPPLPPPPILFGDESVPETGTKREDEETPVQRKARDGSSSTGEAVSSAKGGGRGEPLDAGTRGFMESRFGYDFGEVRIHSDERAAAEADRLQARAFTKGPDLFFARGEFAPGQRDGLRLLAHELAHVAQQGAAAPTGSTAEVERDAHRATERVLRGRRPQLRRRHDGSRPLRFGEPENVPDETYISNQGNQGFLDQAVDYHDAWGLNPQRVGSVEDLVGQLAARTDTLGRLRFVTHAADIGVFSSLFTGGPLLSLQQDRLEAYARSDVEGIRHDLGDWLNVDAALTNLVLTHLRDNHAGMLTPFGIESSGIPGDLLARFIQRALEAEMIAGVRTNANANDADPVIDALDLVLADLHDQVAASAGIAAADAQALEAAIRGTPVNFGAVTFNQQQSRQLRAALRGTGAGFRGDLEAVRNRFDENSWIDIRGCNAGDDVNYLRAFSQFFGSSGHGPNVSAPEWFQVFPTLGTHSLGGASDINGIAADQGVQAALDRWSPLTGARDQIARVRQFYELEIGRRELQRMRSQRSGNFLGGGGLLGGGGFLGVLGPAQSPLLPGRPTPTTDEVLIELLRSPGPLQLTSQSLFGGGRFGPSLGDPPDLLLERARERLDELNEADAELHFYFQAALVLPVHEGGGAQDVHLYLLDELRDLAIDHWLDSQWRTAAPGLEALKNGRWNGRDQRRLQALVEHRPGEGGSSDEMVFPPDPRFWQHITTFHP